MPDNVAADVFVAFAIYRSVNISLGIKYFVAGVCQLAAGASLFWQPFW
jgi:hypothetical protein